MTLKVETLVIATVYVSVPPLGSCGAPALFAKVKLAVGEGAGGIGAGTPDPLP